MYMHVCLLWPVQIDAVDEDGRQALAMAVYSNMQETAEELLLAVEKRHESTEPALIWLDRCDWLASPEFHFPVTVVL
jgi:hypothetical protein